MQKSDKNAAARLVYVIVITYKVFIITNILHNTHTCTHTHTPNHTQSYKNNEQYTAKTSQYYPHAHLQLHSDTDIHKIFTSFTFMCTCVPDTHSYILEREREREK